MQLLPSLRPPVAASKAVLCAAFLMGVAPLAHGQSDDDNAQKKRGLVSVPDIEESIQIERALAPQVKMAAPDGQPWYQIVPGTIPVIVSAPHATQPFRNGSYRFADGPGTAALAREVGKLTGATVIHTVYRSPLDPNYYDASDYKAALARLIEDTHAVLVIDIHASSPYRPYDIDIGDLHGRSLDGKQCLVDDIDRLLNADGILALSHDFFAAQDAETVTKFAAAHGARALQFEISATYLDPAAGDLEAHRYAQMLDAVVRFVSLEVGRDGLGPCLSR